MTGRKGGWTVTTAAQGANAHTGAGVPAPRATPEHF